MFEREMIPYNHLYISFIKYLSNSIGTNIEELDEPFDLVT